MAEHLAEISRVTGFGMITIRADFSRSGDAVAEAVGLAMPEALKIVTNGSRWLGWMSPDELLLVLPSSETTGAVRELEQALMGEPGLVADVSDARAIFDMTGPYARDVLAKLCPVDFDSLPADGLRRSRAAQTATAFWRIEDGFRLIGFRSTADYLNRILRNAAIAGSQLAPR